MDTIPPNGYPIPQRPPAHQQHKPLSEVEETATGITWDSEQKEWRREEDVSDGSEASQRTAIDDTTTVIVPDDLEKGGKTALNQDDVTWVEWEGPDDPANPFNWPSFKKWTTTIIVCTLTMVVASAGSAGPGTDSLAADLNASTEMIALSLAAMPLGFGIAPLFTAPLSEAYGRFQVYVISVALYTLFFVPIAPARNIATVIVFRVLCGACASSGSTLAGGTIADLFESRNRGAPMSLFSLAAFAGTAIGPASMGWVEQRPELGWRWINWIQMMIAGLMLAFLILFTKETRGSVLLSRKAKRLRKETGDSRYQCRTDAERASLAILIKISMTRPIYLLCTEAIVALFSLWVGFCWGILFLSLEAVPLVFGEVYGFTRGQIGSVFWAALVAGLIGTGFNFVQEGLYRRNFARKGPEARLYTSLIGGIVFPIGIFIFAFTQGRTHWIVPIIGLGLCFLGIYTIYLAVFNYLADCYTLYASSALSGQSLIRNLAAFSFPLFTTQMYRKLGFQWASFLAGMLGLLLAATPWILFYFGPKIRARSKFAKELERIRNGK